MPQISYSVPILGQPDSTEDPKIATALTALLNAINGGLDSTNLTASPGITTVTTGVASSRPSAGVLGRVYVATDTGQVSIDNQTDWVPVGLSPATSAISATVAAGQILSMTNGGTTATLPLASGLPNGTLVGVRAGGSVTGASPVTVSGSNIFVTEAGSSLSGFAMGQPGAFIVFAAWGSAWMAVAGRADTGWVALGLSANVDPFDGAPYTPSYRTVGNMTFLKGSLVAFGAFSAGATLATLAVGSSPANTIALPTAGDGGSGSLSGRFSAGAAGAIKTTYALGGTSTVIPLNGLSWSLV